MTTTIHIPVQVYYERRRPIVKKIRCRHYIVEHYEGNKYRAVIQCKEFVIWVEKFYVKKGNAFKSARRLARKLNIELGEEIT